MDCFCAVKGACKFSIVYDYFVKYLHYFYERFLQPQTDND